MKARYLFGCLLIVGGIAFFVMWSGQKPKADTSRTVTEEPQASAPQIIPEEAAVGKGAVTNGPLASAYLMAAFVDRVRDAVPPERGTTRVQLKGLQVMFFLSDYVMAAKT